jgi:hypothetical protein
MAEEKDQEQDKYKDTEKRIRITGWVVAFLALLALLFLQDYCFWRWPGEYKKHVFEHQGYINVTKDFPF